MDGQTNIWQNMRLCCWSICFDNDTQNSLGS